MTWIVGLAAAMSVQAAAATAAGPTTVLLCSIPKSEPFAPARSIPKIENRTFRIGPGRLQEWSAQDRQYGPNLCEAVQCQANAGAHEGTVGTASVLYTIGLDRRTGAGYWRVVGATGFRQTEGVCRQSADPEANAKP